MSQTNEDISIECIRDHDYLDNGWHFWDNSGGLHGPFSTRDETVIIADKWDKKWNEYQE